MSSLSTTSDDILACARSLIVAGGYNGLSYADIADVVGSKASIHHHFPSKVDLVRTLVARYREEAEEGMAKFELEVSDPFDQLRSTLGTGRPVSRMPALRFASARCWQANSPFCPRKLAWRSGRISAPVGVADIRAGARRAARPT